MEICIPIAIKALSTDDKLWCSSDLESAMAEVAPPDFVDLDMHAKSAFSVYQPPEVRSIFDEAKTFDTQSLMERLAFVQYAPVTIDTSTTSTSTSPAADATCNACGYEIRDKYMMRVNDETFHEVCLRCCTCLHPLNPSTSCYQRDGRYYCRKDHAELFSQKCRRCSLPLQSSDLVFRCYHATYHSHCFTCVHCGKLLQKVTRTHEPIFQGDEYTIIDSEVICMPDYQAYLFHQSQMTSSTHFALNCAVLPAIPMEFYDPSDSNRKTPKRPRTILNAVQRKQFKAAFEKSPKPCRKVSCSESEPFCVKVREQLAKDTGLSVRVVQMKKLSRKEGDKAAVIADSEGKSIEDVKSESDDENDSEAETCNSATTSGGEQAASKDLLSTGQNPIACLYNMQNVYFQPAANSF